MSRIIREINYEEKIIRVLEQYFPTNREIAIYPYGKFGQMVERILYERYHVTPKYIFDKNNLYSLLSGKPICKIGG